MSIRVNGDGQYEQQVTLNKRKRESFSAKHQSTHNKENQCVFTNFMEVKSISDLIKTKNSTERNDNPYELVRKPPKKKSKRDIDDSCFENPALNINGPEKIINPFEVKREPVVEQENHCFINPGLNIRVVEREVANPFEIHRDAPLPKEVQGIENPGLDLKPILAIGVPFTPTLGCRIDFNNVPLEALTPCSMLSNKLVFSPINKPADLTPKRPNLSIISEEAVDISKELDTYQLVLENSMNEAKATRKRGNKNLLETKRRNSLVKRLIESIDANEDNEETETEKAENDDIAVKEHSCHDSIDGQQSECPKSSTPKTPNENCIAKYPLDKSVNENPDVVYEEVEETRVEIAIEKETEEDEPLFKNPAPFVRTYRRDVRKPAGVNQKRENQSGVVSQQSEHEDKPKENHDMFGSLRSSIRKSIRKLIHPNASGTAKNGHDAANSEPTNILSSIRQSLRRKPAKQPLATSTPCDSLHDISVIDCPEPRVVFKETIDTNHAVKVEAVSSEVAPGVFVAKSNIRRSFRKSSRNVIKSVFKKNVEDYNFGDE